MASKQDARPFVDLQKDAEEFVAKFNEDITEWKNVLNSKITSLICDPDSFGNPKSYEKNPVVEFSKAKYAIFISMKSLANETEKEWFKYISEMKKLFLENVEIFLAGTKLEVKLPSSECQPISGTKKSPANRKSNLMSSSLYPIISNFTKNIPVLNSPLRNMEAHTSEPEKTEAMASRGNRSFTSKMEIDEDDMDLNTSRSSNRSWKSPKLHSSDLNASREKGKSVASEINSHVLPNDGMEIEEAADVESKSSKMQDLRNKSKLAAQSKKSKAKGILKKGSSGSESQNEEASKLVSELDCRVTIKRYIAEDRTSNIQGVVMSSTESQEDELESEKNSAKVVKGRGRRGKKVEEAVEENAGPSQISSRKSVRGTLRSNKTAVAKANEQSSSEENEKFKETEINTNASAIRGRRGKKAALKEKENVFKPDNQDSEAAYEEEKDVPLVIRTTRKGRSATAKTLVESSDPVLVSNTRKGRSTIKEEVQVTKFSHKSTGRKSLQERISESDTSLSPVRVILPVEEDINANLDIYTPVARKSTARRKTLLPNLDEIASVSEDTVKGNSSRAKSKRKTISGVSDLASMAPSKRLKISSSQRSNAIIEDEAAVGDDNLLGTNDSYSEWIALKNVDEKIPTVSAIYEVKVWRAKKSAYIGSSESLRHTLTLHKLKQNSGHKHLDKFIDRNYNDIQVRYEVVPSLNAAKAEVKNRINSFVAQHKTTPAYN